MMMICEGDNCDDVRIMVTIMETVVTIVVMMMMMTALLVI